MKSLALFCGSKLGFNDRYEKSVIQLIHTIHSKNFGLIYGGGKVGLMGVVADTAKALNCRITGVIPQFLIDKELASDGLSELIVVNDMHQRKKKMIELASGFICLPGGTGTAEEFFEAWTWGQLGLHSYPCAIFNVDGCYDSLIRYIEDIVKNGFMNQRYLDSLIISDSTETLFSKIEAFKAVEAKWNDNKL